ncbi:DUF1648 domain-containing protein [Cellulomonas taurus]|uniref:DUF1648 domain-containing protein n=1 Tax=Cellulomonas taurus TaxID=2729175 RepID=UPI00145D1B30|nr:DUF1648 domain-containing protein [Cellulomonas taurus]
MNHRLSTTLLALLPSAALLTAAGLVSWSWRDDLPDPVATHFGADGADGFGSFGGFVGVLLAVFGAVAVIGWLIALLRGQSSITRRIGVGVAVGASAFGASNLLGTLNASRGLSDATQVGAVDGVIAVSTLAGLALGALAAWAVPGDRPVPARGSISGPRLPLSSHERAVWSQQVSSPVGLGVGGVTTVGMLVLAVVLRMPALILIGALLAALLATMLVFRVTVDATGLRLRSALGWPRTHVPATEIVGVEVAQVSPFREFGGWGVRVGRGGEVGWVLRAGEAIRVLRTGGRDLVVTVPDAATGAALLTTLAERAQDTDGPTPRT